MATPDNELRTFWDDILVTDPDLGHYDAHPGELVIGTQNRVLVRIQPDGQLRFESGYTPDGAAEEFWTAMALKRKGMEERLLHLGLLENMLVRIGIADMRAERTRRIADGVDATNEDTFIAERAMANLESLVHQMIEVSRGLAMRK